MCLGFISQCTHALQLRSASSSTSTSTPAGCRLPMAVLRVGNRQPWGAMGREGCAGGGKWPQTSEDGGGAWHAEEGARGGEEVKAWQPEGGLSCRGF